MKAVAAGILVFGLAPRYQKRFASTGTRGIAVAEPEGTTLRPSTADYSREANMRAIRGVILLGAIGAGCGPGAGFPGPTPSPSVSVEECNGKVTIKLAPNQYPQDGARGCDVVAVAPDNVEVCTNGKITWTFVNGCGTPVHASIGARKRKYPPGKPGEPLTTEDALPASPNPIPHDSSGTVTAQVKSDNQLPAEPDLGIYKYDIVGTYGIFTFTFDPEIDVRRGPNPFPDRR